jgi:hypothetical protein
VRSNPDVIFAACIGLVPQLNGTGGVHLAAEYRRRAHHLKSIIDAVEVDDGQIRIKGSKILIFKNYRSIVRFI